MESVLEAQDSIGRIVEAAYPETDIGIDRVERVLSGVSTDLNTQGCHPQVAGFLETVERVSKVQFPLTWEYVENVLEVTVPGDSYRDEASRMLRFTMGYEASVPDATDLPPTDDPCTNKMRDNAIKELHDWARNARREHRQPRASPPHSEL